MKITFFVAALVLAFTLNCQSLSAQTNIDKSQKNFNPSEIFNRFKSKKNTSNVLDPCDPVPISYGQTVNGSLVTGDCPDPDSTQVADVYIFNGTQGQQISASMSSSQFDTVLVLFDLSGNVVTFNDDIDDSTTNSRIPPTGTFTLPFTGQYILFATSFDETGRGNYTLTLSGSGSSCSFILNPTGQFFPATGGNGTFTVTASAPNCAWQATSTASWIVATSSGTGNGTVAFSVASNSSAQGRAGIITVGGVNFVVTQGGLICEYTISPAAMVVPATGGQFSLTVTASNPICPTNMSTADSWITILNPTGTGTRTVNFTVTINNSLSVRTGVFTVLNGGRQSDITQKGRTTAFSFNTAWLSDIGVFRPSNGTWYLQITSPVTLEPGNTFRGFQFGIATDKITPADYDGDTLTDIAVFREGYWYIIESRNSNFRAVYFGSPADKPIPGDFDGDGKADISVYRPSTGGWYRQNSSNGQFFAAQFGASEDVPLMTDFNADGRNEIAVFRPSNGAWYWLDSGTGNFNAVTFGLGTDIPVPADYDGDSKTDIAVYRPSNGSWYRFNSTNGQFFGMQFGASEDIPVPANYDGDEKTDIAVFRPSNGAWYIMRSRTNTFGSWIFGTSGDKPIQSAYQP